MTKSIAALLHASFSACLILALPLNVSAQPSDENADQIKVQYGDKVREITLHPRRMTTLHFAERIRKVLLSHTNLFTAEHEYGTELIILPTAAARTGDTGHIIIHSGNHAFNFDLRVVKDRSQSMLTVACGDGADSQPLVSRPAVYDPNDSPANRQVYFPPSAGADAMERMRRALDAMFAHGQLLPSKYALLLVLSSPSRKRDRDDRAIDDHAIEENAILPVYCRQGSGMRRCGYIVESEDQFSRSDL